MDRTGSGTDFPHSQKANQGTPEGETFSSKVDFSSFVSDFTTFQRIFNFFCNFEIENFNLCENRLISKRIFRKNVTSHIWYNWKCGITIFVILDRQQKLCVLAHWINKVVINVVRWGADGLIIGHAALFNATQISALCNDTRNNNPARSVIIWPPPNHLIKLCRVPSFVLYQSVQRDHLRTELRTWMN